MGDEPMLYSLLVGSNVRLAFRDAGTFFVLLGTGYHFWALTLASLYVTFRKSWRGKWKT